MEDILVQNEILSRRVHFSYKMSNQLFFLSLADIFSVYPTIFNEIVSKREKTGPIFLPSDKDWQEKMYHRLLEAQKKVNEALNSGKSLEEITKRKDNPMFEPLYIDFKTLRSNSPNTSSRESRRECNGQILSTVFIDKYKSMSFWSLENISKAARLLKNPPLPVTFENEYEMRKVYSLIYDVFRYKIILSGALNDVSFFAEFPQFKSHHMQVWLMLFELSNRQFKKRNAEYTRLEAVIYQEAGVKEISFCLWNYRVRLAASISRMRIMNSALKLSDLLPVHLQNEKVAIAAASPIVSGWVNPFKLSNRTVTDQYLQKCGLLLQEHLNKESEFTTNVYIWDTVCPLFISCIPQDRNLFTKSKLITNNMFVMQDRTFSLGPAIMSRLLDYFEMDGDILQTHISSPRSTAYLAALFYSVNRLNCFFVYGAGSNLNEYREYMESLGITNIRLFAESFASIPLESNRLGSVVGIFATPPNSYSAISDPIDLICSRGGDLRMLEVLTESQISENGKQRVTQILEEQMVTLQMAMSRPQIQFILYQTHSIVRSENEDMVKHARDLVNKIALRKHQEKFKETKRLEALFEAEAGNFPSAAVNTKSPRKANSSKATDNTKSLETSNVINKNTDIENDYIDDVSLPNIDEFVIEKVPDICIYQDNCLSNFKPSSNCFLSLLTRKQVTRLNAKHLIKMAESRGLFGKGDKNIVSIKPKISKTIDKTSSFNYGSSKQQVNKSIANIHNIISRLNKPTNASTIRSNLNKISHQQNPMMFNFKRRECYRYLMEFKEIVKLSKVSKTFSPGKLWWKFALAKVRSAIRTAFNDGPCASFDKDDVNRSERLNIFKIPYPTHIYDVKLCNI